jgi:transcriptional regulator with XRE-family HTH domain/quercetin dioxygenase-like cupin family protein
VPVYRHLSESYRLLQIGGRIRRERRRRRWTLATLAKRIGISVASLSAIENEKALVNVDRLLAIGEALGVRADTLFSRTESHHFHITRRSTAAEPALLPPTIVDEDGRSRGTYDNPIRPLAAPFVGKHIEPVAITVLPLPDASVSFISHHHEEFFVVLSGAVECLLETPDGRLRERLAPGDCMYFRSHLPHCIRALGNTPAHTIHVLCAALGDTDDERVVGDLGPIVRRERETPLSACVAARLKSLRQRRGQSLTDCAAAVGISARRLAAVEDGRRPVPFDLLLRVCALFRKPVEYFLADALISRPFFVVQRAAGIRQLKARVRRDQPPGNGTQNVFKSLADRFGRRGMYPYYVTVTGQGSRQVTMHEHHGQEFVYVLNGEVTLVTRLHGNKIFETLSRGDSCFLDSTVPHRFIAATPSPYRNSSAELLDVFWCPLGEDYLFVADATRGRRRAR